MFACSNIYIILHDVTEDQTVTKYDKYIWEMRGLTVTGELVIILKVCQCYITLLILKPCNIGGIESYFGKN